MIALPAVDIREGRCVQLVGGRPEEERVSLPDPVAVARRWWDAGFGELHVVDLDAALDRGSNRELVAAVIAATGARMQVGGGVRTAEAVKDLLAAGARRVVVGTRAATDRAWLETVARDHPGRLVVAADVREGEVLVRGWTETTGRPVEGFLRGLAEIPVAGVLCTDVAREGRVEGIDRPGVRSVLEASPHPVWISGGIRSLDDLRFLEEAGAAGAVLGMALYTDVLDGDAVAREYGR